jgi:hypothetical protein
MLTHLRGNVLQNTQPADEQVTPTCALTKLQT